MQTAYPLLRDNGINLDEECIDWILEQFDKGISQAYDHFGMQQPAVKNINWNLTDVGIGVDFDPDTYVISAGFIKKIEDLGVTSVEQLKKLAVTIPVDDNYSVEISLYHKLVSAGIEETIHIFQNQGHPVANLRMTKGYQSHMLSFLGRKLLDYECQARRLVDIIMDANGEPQVWKEFDAYLIAIYPKRYNKSIEKQYDFENLQHPN